jgi:hypothetical protein
MVVLYRKPMVALANMILYHESYIPEEVQIAERQAQSEAAAEAEAEAARSKDTTAGKAKRVRKAAKKVQGPSEEKKTVEKEVLADLAAAQKIMRAVLKSAGGSQLEYRNGWELYGPELLNKIKF